MHPATAPPVEEAPKGRRPGQEAACLSGLKAADAYLSETPKEGIQKPFRKEYAVVNIRDLKVFTSGSMVDRKALKDLERSPA